MSPVGEASQNFRIADNTPPNSASDLLDVEGYDIFCK
jgi:hypothetical protein